MNPVSIDATVSATLSWLMRNELQMKPAGHETNFVGAWKFRRESIAADPTCERIEMHGGGPPRLTCLTTDAARSKYGAVVDS